MYKCFQHEKEMKLMNMLFQTCYFKDHENKLKKVASNSQ